jgi:hypothetical protein
MSFSLPSAKYHICWYIKSYTDRAVIGFEGARDGKETALSRLLYDLMPTDALVGGGGGAGGNNK